MTHDDSDDACIGCDGTGRCMECDGDGHYCGYGSEDDERNDPDNQCPDCHGSGDCPECHGSGLCPLYLYKGPSTGSES